VSNWQSVQWARAPVPAAVLKSGLALLTTGSVPGVPAVAAEQVWAVKFPNEQVVAAPFRLYPELQVIWQTPPEASVDEQVPKLPFAGGDTEHALGVQVCAVRTPLEQDVEEPTRV
jgi:hypothetical protein